MVVDTSVLVALFLSEPGHEAFTDAIDEAAEAHVSVVSRVELVSVLCGKRHRADPALVADFIDGLHLEHVPVSTEQMSLAIEALLRFGKGRHPAKLNLGDCFSYALAKSRRLPLLFKGDDFARTDIVPAWRP
jgi:ribonuclease VapC